MTSALTHFGFWFSTTFCFILNEELKYFINWDRSFWLTLFWGCFLEFLSIIIPVSWRAVYDLEIPSWLPLDSKLSTSFFHFVFHVWYLVILMLGSPFNSECPRDYFWEKLSISFWMCDKLVTLSIFPCFL